MKHHNNSYIGGVTWVTRSGYVLGVLSVSRWYSRVSNQEVSERSNRVEGKGQSLGSAAVITSSMPPKSGTHSPVLPWGINLGLSDGQKYIWDRP